MEKTFIVQGRGLEEALDKAAILLHCEKERVAYEILRRPGPGRYGQPGVPCKLRVTPVSESADVLSAARESDPLWDVTVPLSPEELATLPPGFFLKDMGEALARDLAGSALAAAGTARHLAARRVITGAVSQLTGPIDHVGDLEIHGDVCKGVRLTATGAIVIEGGVETAFLDAGGDIQIREGLLGTARSAGGSIRCRFAQGAQIEALVGDVAVAESAMHCRIQSGCSVGIGDLLLGGWCYGEELVQARIAGSDSGVPTAIHSGHNLRAQMEVERVRERAQSHLDRLKEIDAVREEFLPQEEAGRQTSPENRARLWRAVLRKSRLNADLRQLLQKKTALLGMINAEKGSRICITDRIYPGVKIGIDDAGLEIHRVTQYATFSKDYESGDLRLTPYH